MIGAIFSFIGKALLAAIVLVIGIGVWGHISRLDSKPPYTLVTVDGDRALHTLCEGPQDAPLVIYDAGMFGIYADGWWVKEALKQDFRVCLYDRAGLGWSDPVPVGTSPSPLFHIEDMRRLARAVGATPPYYLVGHSAAGIRLHAFATLYPEDIAGLVFVDAASPARADAERIGTFLAIANGMMHVSAATARIGFAGGLAALVPDPLSLPTGPRGDKNRATASPRHHKATRAEFGGFRMLTDDVGTEAASELPMSVIIAGDRPDTNVRLAQERAARGAFARWHLLEGESHVSVLNEQNAAIIADDIRAMRAAQEEVSR